MIENLVFKGGGVKGIAYVGVLAALEQLNLENSKFDLKNIKRVGGTSAGAIIALAFALGLTAKELQKLLSELDFGAFLDDKAGKKTLVKAQDAAALPSIFRSSTIVSDSSGVSKVSSKLSKDFGIFPGNKLRGLFEDILQRKTGINHCTFQEFKDNGFKDLRVVGFNLNTQLAETFCVENTPDMVIADAIRISMSIPYIFKPHRKHLKREGQRQAPEPDIYVDGGVAENYPINLFNKKEGDTLGFYPIVGKEAAFLSDETTAPPRKEIVGFKGFTLALMEALIGNDYSNLARSSDDKERTVIIDLSADERSKNVGSLDFHLSSEQQNGLMQVGWAAVQKYFLGAKLEVTMPEEFAVAQTKSTDDSDVAGVQEKKGCAMM